MTLLVDISIRSSVVIVVALAATVALWRYSAAVRHNVLAAAIFCAASVLPFALLLPAWEVPISTQPTTPVERVVSFDPPVVASSGVNWPGSVGGDTGSTTRSAITAVVWTSGVALGALLLVGALVRLARITTRAKSASDGPWPRVVAELSTKFGIRRPVQVLFTDATDGPATWGLWRPAVLLPTHAFGWTEKRAYTVLCHELAHVARRDWIVQIVAELLRIVFWFNPLFWIASARLRRESEQACDDAVLDAGVPADEYASHLLEVARSCHRTAPALVSALPIARPSTLERRIAAMLNPTLNRRALTRHASVITALALLCATVPTAIFRAAAQDGPRSLSGTVYDTSGGVLPGVAVTLIDAQQVKWETTTERSGRFEFAPVGAGDYVLEASLPGFRSLRHDIVLSHARDWDQPITLQVGSLEETITVTGRRGPQGRAAQTGARLKVGGQIKAPLKVKHVNPQYPQAMQDSGVEGVVPMEAVIGPDGNVTSVRVLSAQVHPELAKAAVDAVQQWGFTPTLLNGVPVEVLMTVTVQFGLTD